MSDFPTMDFQPRDPDFDARVRRTFATQPFLELMGAELLSVGPGAVSLMLPHRPDLTQHHGYFHGGAVATLADVTGGFAALSLMAAQAQVLTVEFKINLLAPGVGERLVTQGRVLRSGRTLTVCRADILAETGAERKLIASALGTYMASDG